MTYANFERLVISVGALAIGATTLLSLLNQPLWEEVVAQLLLLAVLIGAVHWGRRGGFIAALIASGIYVIMRIPMLVADGLTEDLIVLMLIRTLTYGLVGILGGELCGRIKYVFAELEDSNGIDPLTKVYNVRQVARLIDSATAQYARYGTTFSVIVLNLDPALLSPLRKSRQRSMLRAIANHIRNDIRLVDELGRVGESTFAMLLPQTGGEGAAIAAERVRGGVRDLLGARDESVCTDVLAAPEDIEGLNELQSSFETATSDTVEEYEPASAA